MIKLLHPYCFNPDKDLKMVSLPEIDKNHVYIVPEGDYFTISKTEEQFKQRIKYLQTKTIKKHKYITRFQRLLNE